MKRRSSVRRLAMAAILTLTTTASAQYDAIGILERRPEGADRLRWHVADPANATESLNRLLEAEQTTADEKFIHAVLDSLKRLHRPRQVRLSLEDIIHRTLANSYAVRIQSYSPAISTAAMVEAESAFDAIFFLDLNKNKRNQPVASDLAGSKVDTLTFSGGIRKLLPTGTQVSASLNLNRTSTDNRFQTINPVYTSGFVASLNQPLMRGGGIDFNRSNIVIARNDLGISRHVFQRAIRDILFETERAYWLLVQARREVVIRARLLAEFEKTYNYLYQRRDFDIYQIQLSQTKANVESSKADYIRVLNDVRDAEDALLALMNDPELDLVEDVEIIPSDFPEPIQLDIDREASARVALDRRCEIVESRLQVENSAIRAGVAKNQAMPRFDLGFQYSSNGLGEKADSAFSQATQNNFLDYLVTLSFEVPVGNRGPQAVARQARLAHAQAIANYKNQMEQIILDVNTAARAIQTAYDRLDPSMESADANEDQVTSTVARQERKDFTALNQELNARSSLANSRSTLLNDLVTYHIAVIALERAKGTLLDFNNIKLLDLEH